MQHWFSNTFHVNVQKQSEYLDKSTQKVISSGGSIIEKTVLSISSIVLILVFIDYLHFVYLDLSSPLDAFCSGAFY